MRRSKYIRMIVTSAVIGIACAGIGAGAYFHQSSVSVSASTSKGMVNEKAKSRSVRVRTAADTSDDSNIITGLYYNTNVDILRDAGYQNGYDWFYIGFYYNGDYRYGYIVKDYVDVLSDGDSGDSDPVPTYDSDGDFENSLNEQGFPESYKSYLRQIHSEYPTWIFQADHTGVDWNQAVSEENVLGRSLIYNSAISSWKSTDDNAYNWETSSWYGLDGSGWVQASPALVNYVMDPRNYLDSTHVFAFEDLSYQDSQSTSGVRNIIAGTFMANSNHDLSYDGTQYDYASALMAAGRISGVSPYHLASRIRQEVGVNGSGSVSGTEPGYEGLYNYYNQGAVTGGGRSAIQNGLVYASKENEFDLRPWNTRMRSIIGGAKNIGSKYINKGQDTLYYEKFDLEGFWHQYMTNIMAPRSESQTSSRAYSDEMKQDTAFVFTIPVYENMPGEVQAQPTGDGSPNCLLRNITVDDFSLTPSFDKWTTEYDVIVPYETTSVYVDYFRYDYSSECSGYGDIALNVGENVVPLTVTAENGDSLVYTVTIVRKDNPASAPSPESNQNNSNSNEQKPYSVQIGLNVNNSFVSGIEVGSSASDVLAKIQVTNGRAVYEDKDGNEKSGAAVTGDKVVLFDNNGNQQASYDVVIYGDTNGDGKLSILDIIKIKNDILDKVKLEGAFAGAADVNRDGKANILDIIKIKNDIQGKASITQ